MSEQKPANPGRRRFLEGLFSNLGREAGLLAREARQAAREVDRALADVNADVDADANQPSVVEMPGHAALDASELAKRLDAIAAEISEVEGQVQGLVEAAAQPQPLADDDRALLRRVAELLAERHLELADEPSAPEEAEDDAGDSDNESAVLRRRRKVLKEKVWALITALLGVRLFDALYETFVAEELVPLSTVPWVRMDNHPSDCRWLFASARRAADFLSPSLLAARLWRADSGNRPPDWGVTSRCRAIPGIGWASITECVSPTLSPGKRVFGLCP